MDFKVTGKVLAHSLFWQSDKKKAAVESVTVENGRDYYYKFTPNAEAGAQYRHYQWSFEEVEIIKQLDGKYVVNFYSNSSIYVRSDTPFLSIETTKEDLCNWNAGDTWFERECHYRVSRSGKRTHGAKRSWGKYTEERCDICGYPAKDNECPRCKIRIKRLSQGRERSPHLVAAVNHYIAQGAELTDNFIVWPTDWKEGMSPLSKG